MKVVTALVSQNSLDMLASNIGRFYLLLLMRLSSAMTSLAVYTQLDGLATQISPVGWINKSRASWMGRAELPKERHRIMIKGSSWMDVQRIVRFFYFTAHAPAAQCASSAARKALANTSSNHAGSSSPTLTRTRSVGTP